MMKTIIRHIINTLLIIAVLPAMSCIYDDMPEAPTCDGSNTLSFTISSENMAYNTQSRAGDPDPEALKAIDIYLYAGTKAYHWTADDFGIDEAAMQRLSKHEKLTFTKSLTPEESEALKNNPGRKMLLIGNKPANITATGYNDLWNKTMIESKGFSSIVYYGYIDKLTQVEEGKFEGKDIVLHHLPSKIRIGVSQKSNIPEHEINFAGIEMKMYNICYGRKLNNIDDDSNHQTNYNALESTDFRKVGAAPLTIDSKGKETIYASAPFYSYYNRWKSSSEYETYCTLKVPVKKTHESEYKDQYYKIRIAPGINEINTRDDQFYDIRIYLNMLGSEDETKPVNIDASLSILPWFKSGKLHTSLDKVEYLVVQENKKSIYNDNKTRIKYESSELPKNINCIVKSVQSQNTKNPLSPDENISTYGFNARLEDGYINVSHTLTSEDYRPYKITVEVSHKNNSVFKETIVIDQYPEMYIVARKNSGYINQYNQEGKGYTFIAGYHINNTTTDFNWIFLTDKLDEINPLNEDVNNNPNTYLINVSNVPEGKYIADPRTMVKNFEIDKITDYTNHTLKKYYKCADSKEAKNQIAPKIRVASSYGKSYPLGYKDAMKRCASYQEDGYPAGRWRLPTNAELEYIVSLSNAGKIPRLFAKSKSGYNVCYWTSTNRAYIMENVVYIGKNANDYYYPTFTRCVYDEWYWGSDRVEKTTFKWANEE